MEENQSLVNRSTDGLYEPALTTIVENVLNRFSHLLDKEEDLACLQRYLKLSLNARKLYVRLLLRKWQWIRLDKTVQYREITENINLVARELSQFGGFLLDGTYLNLLASASISSNSVEGEIPKNLAFCLDLLTVEELKRLVKKYKIPVDNAGKTGIISIMLEYSQKQATLFGVSMKDRILKDCRANLGTMVCVSEAKAASVQRAFLLHYCPTVWINTMDSFKNEILTLIQKRRYPSYNLSSVPIFRDRQQLIDYETALKHEYAILELAENKKDEECDELWRTLWPTWEMMLIEFMDPARTDNPFLLQYHPGYVYTRMASGMRHTLGRLKKYQTELNLLWTLLSQRQWLTGKRGKWWSRLLLIMHTHCSPNRKITGQENNPKRRKLDASEKNPMRDHLQETLKTISMALEDPELKGGYRHDILKRQSRIEKQLESMQDNSDRNETDTKTDLLELVPAVEKKQLLPVPEIVVYGTKINHGTVGKSQWLLKQSESLNVQDGMDKENISLGSVEDLALGYFFEQGWSGVKSEGSLWMSALALLFWDIYFMDVPGVFIHSYHVAPLDFGSIWFYEQRKGAIDARLKQIAEGSDDYWKNELKRIWDREFPHQTFCVGMNWNFLENQIVSFIECITIGKLCKILYHIITDYATHHSGWPDLVLWKDGEKGEEKEIKIVEVKGPGDRLSGKQEIILQLLQDTGVPVAVCRVKAITAD